MHSGVYCSTTVSQEVYGVMLQMLIATTARFTHTSEARMLSGNVYIMVTRAPIIVLL